MERFPSERSGDDARAQRLSVLRDLAHEATAPAAMATDATEPAPSQSVPMLGKLTPTSPRRATSASSTWRRWWGVALVVVVAVAICRAVLGSIGRWSGLSLGAFGAKPAPALTSKVFALQAARGTLSCPSTPVWSPNGKQFAVVALEEPSPDGCIPYNAVTNIQRTDSGSVTMSGPQPTTFALVIFDATTGHAVRTITLPALTDSLLCAGATPCVSNPLSDQAGVQTPALQSIGWSPDGRTIGVFFTYVFNAGDFIHYESRGALIVVPMDGPSAPRAFIAKGRVKAMTYNISSDSIYTQPRFTWDLSTGKATYADIHQGAYPLTVVFAPGYHLGSDGALALDPHAQPGDLSPWRGGVLIPNGPQGSGPAISYQTSQWLWSSDSRFVTPNLDTAAYLTIAGVTGATPAASSFITTAETTIAPPDAATAQAVTASARTSSVAALARNPTGALLAEYRCLPSGAGLLTIRSVATGKALAQASYSYPLTSASLGCAGDLGPIIWSPDGTRIVAADSPDGQFIVWRVNVHA